MAMHTNIRPARQTVQYTVALMARRGLRGSLISVALFLLIGLAPLAYGDFARRAQRRRLNDVRRENASEPYKLLPATTGHPASVYRAARAVA